MTAELTDPARLKRVEATLWGNKETGAPGLVDMVNRHELMVTTHQRVIFGVPAEQLRGILPALTALEEAFKILVDKVDDMSDGKKTLLTLVGFGVSSLTGLGALLTALTTLYVVLARGGG